MNAEPGPVRVREAGPRDLAAVEVIERACFGDPWSREALYGELLADAMRLPLVAELEGAVCGFLMAWRVLDQLHVLNIAAAPEARRRGVGTALLRAAAGLARADGLREITLEVRAGNAGARRFYAVHGFAEVGLRRRYYADNGEDAVIMTADVARILAGG